MWFSVDCVLIDNDTGHHSSQDLLWNHWFIHACRHKQNFHGNLNGFLVTFNAIFTFYLRSVSFRTLCRVLYSSEFSFMKLISSSDTLTKREAVILKICPRSCYNYLCGGDYLSNRPHFPWVHRRDKPRAGDVGRTREKLVNHEPKTSDLQAFWVFHNKSLLAWCSSLAWRTLLA